MFDLIRFGFLRGSPLTSPCAVAGRDAAFKGFGSRQDGCRIPECFAEATFIDFWEVEPCPFLEERLEYLAVSEAESVLQLTGREASSVD